MNNDKGYIKLFRSSMNDPLYHKERFTKWQAWCDLLLLSYYAPGEFFVRSVTVKARRGCVYVSAIDLAKRWRWSRGKVSRFLNYLAKDNRITIESSNVINCIAIVNYEKYQQPENKKEEPQASAPAEPAKAPLDLLQSLAEQVNAIKERLDAKEKKQKPSSPYLGKPIDEREQEFYNSLVDYVPTYGKEMVRKFYDYWSERNKSNSRMRFENERTWELPRRLSTWASRDNSFNNNNNGSNEQAKQKRAADAIGIIAQLEAEERGVDGSLWQ